MDSELSILLVTRTCFKLEPKALDAVLAATHAMTGVIRTLHLNKEVMLKYARENFSTMTDLADLLVREGDLDFRHAHELIATVVVDAIAQKKTADQITLKMLQAAAKKQLGHELKINERQLATALDPVQSVEHKTGLGMPAAASVKAMISAAQKTVGQQEQWLNSQQTYLQQTNGQLLKILNNYR